VKLGAGFDARGWAAEHRYGSPPGMDGVRGAVEIMGKWLRRIALGVVGVLALTVLAGAAFEGLSRRAAAKSFPPPGRLVDVGGGRRIQLDCRGTGTPIVVFESGLDTLGSLAWTRVQPQVAATTRACAYSRAGVMWSDPASGAFDVRQEARDLHNALAAAGEKPPFVMVGHSLGGPYLLTYTGLYGGEVAGLVFVDASHPDQIARLRNAIGQDVPESVGMMKAANALSWSGAVRLFAPKEAIAPPSAPPGMVAVAAAWQPQSIHGAVRESDGLAQTLAIAGQSRRLGNRPLVVLTRTAKAPLETLKVVGLSADQGRRMDDEWRAMQDDEATWSSRSRHQFVPNASHYIQLDQPQAVIAAVQDVVSQVRADASARPQ
jgi:pimeloyl-ACP methyl ester carboxylesterase